MIDLTDFTKIGDLKNGIRNLNIKAIILEINCLKMRSTQEEYYVLKISDDSAQIKCTLFDNRAALLKCGDIIYMQKCYTKYFHSELTLYKYTGGNLFKIDDFCMVYNDTVDMSAKTEPLQEQINQNNVQKEAVVTRKRTFQQNNENSFEPPAKKPMSFATFMAQTSYNPYSYFRKPNIPKTKHAKMMKKKNM